MARRSRMRALNLREPRIQHRWTQEERMLLCCTKRFFDLSNNNITKIFNNIYETKIRDEGFPNGLPKSTLVIQWEDNKRKNHKDWLIVHREVAFQDGPAFFPQLFEKIRTSAQRLHIGLVPRARDLTITFHERPTVVDQGISQRRDSMQHQVPDIVGNTIIPQSPLNALIADQQRQTNAISPIPLESISRIRSYTWPINMAGPPARTSNVPNLTWRFANDDSMGVNHRSGYIAEAFINKIGMIPGPEDLAREFPEFIKHHVKREKIPTSFISTSVDPLVPFHRAMTSGKNAFVALIDTDQINPEHIFYMKDLMRRFNIYTPGYRGAAEYVIWGTICRAAIVVSFKAADLLVIAEQHHDIQNALQLDIISQSTTTKRLHDKLARRTYGSDNGVGNTIGKFLRLIRLQRDYIDDVARALNGSWSFAKAEDLTDFMCGVRQGYQAITVAPPLNVPTTETVFPSQETLTHTLSQTQDGPHYISLDDVSEPRLVEDSRDTKEYVIVNHSHEEAPTNDLTIHDQELRQSMERFSIHDAGEEASVPSYQANTNTDLLSGVSSTVDTPTISVFHPGSDSWILVPEIRPCTPDRKPLQSIDDDDEDNDVKPIVMPVSPGSRTGYTQEPQPAICQTPIKSHNRSNSEASDSTIGKTPTKHRESELLSNVDRVLGYDWPTFWDNLAHQ